MFNIIGVMEMQIKPQWDATTNQLVQLKLKKTDHIKCCQGCSRTGTPKQC